MRPSRGLPLVGTDETALSLRNARAQVAETLARYPGASIESFAVFDPSWSELERYRLIETMRKAGFPACTNDPEKLTNVNARRLPECVAG